VKTYPTGTKEWACKNFNVCSGCKNDCRYCYAKSMAIRFGRRTAETWKDQIPLPDKLAEVGGGKPTRIMFPSTHDITSEHLDLCMEALNRMLSRKHTVLVVSKPHADCIRAICEQFGEYKDKMLFRFTIGSADNNALKFWEPNAPLFEERMLSLEIAHQSGYQTSVSCEPMLDCAVEKVVEFSLPLVTDSIWIGIMNDIGGRLKINGADADTLTKGKALVQSHNREWISGLYLRLKDNPKIRWKDSIKKMLDLERPTMPGLDT